MAGFAALLGESPTMIAVREQVEHLLAHRTDGRRLPPILIQGETGTGKGMLAAAIHRASPRADGPFVSVNCAAIPDTLLEAEMFGFERGAFTDARQAKAGLFQTAHRGTLFLDEVALVPESVQVKLLKALEEREVRRLGSTRSEPVDVWILAATSEDLAVARRERRFHEALYHRLAVLTFTMPPLRERGRDILLLAEHFLERACADYRLPAKTFTRAAREALARHRWSGNVRELANAVERVALLTDGTSVDAIDLGLAVGEGPAPAPRPADGAPGLERERLLEALRATGGNVSRAAVRLGLSRNTLRYRMERLELGATRTSRVPPASIGSAPRAPATGVVRWEHRILALLHARVRAEAADTGAALAPVIEKIASFDGRVEETGIGGVVAAFGVEPIEDAAHRAALAALAIQRVTGPDGAVVAVHAGRFLVGRLGETPSVDLDDRHHARAVLADLLGRAAPGAIVVSEAARGLLRGRFHLAGLESGAGPAYALSVAETPAVVRASAGGFVGRAEELRLLEGRLAAIGSGGGHLIGIVGDAGIGKSRLLAEFRAVARVPWLEGRCLSYGQGIPYLPFLDLVRQQCGVSGGVALEPEGAPYLLRLLGVDDGGALGALHPETVKARTFEALRRLLFDAARQAGRLVVVIEDLHWIDSTSQECLGALLESLAGAPILAILTYRPGVRPPGLERSYATQLTVKPLATEESLAVIHGAVPERPPSEPLARAIVGRAEGNPFFLEELARATAAGGDDAGATAVPTTVEGVLTARMAQLPEDSRRLLATAAVLGREFPLRLLRAVWPGNVEPPLTALRRLEFLHEMAGTGEPAWVFKHALTHEVAYESVRPPERAAAHARAVEVLEGLYAGRLDEIDDRLAHHAARSGDPERAVRYLKMFAERAARAYAHTEALAALAEAVAHAERLPSPARERARVDLLFRRARSLSLLGRLPETLALLEREAPLVEAFGDPALAGRFHFLLGNTCSLLGERARATAGAEGALAEAGRAGDTRTVGKAHFVLALEGFWSGRLRDGVAHGRAAIARLDGLADRAWLGRALWATGFNHTLLGEFEAALDAEARAGEIGAAVGDLRLQRSAAWTTGGIHALAGDGDAAVAACRRGLEGSTDPLNTALGTGWLGYAHLERGEPADAIPRLAESIASLERFRFRPAQGWFTAWLGEALLSTGRVDEAATTATDAVAVATAAGHPYGVGLAQRVLGWAAEARGDAAGARRWLDLALATFAGIDAGFEAGRTHLALAVLARGRGQDGAAKDEARQARRRFEALGLTRFVARAEALGA
ncbi:MAG TPA: sigma 54-interacting transcriptional regulator [Methylomirabilota bacterium]|jgi:transcriptional regulator with AAA-type ATPase domain/tetratricopeptide (TPR) repeat protein|nr:sigma 54-interacting transcriptional regulator [Methylomirabilota bacterium]